MKSTLRKLRRLSGLSEPIQHDIAISGPPSSSSFGTGNSPNTEKKEEAKHPLFKLQQTVYEIVNTEKDYIKDLNTIINVKKKLFNSSNSKN